MKRVILTYRYRIKDATTAKRLRAHARAVNPVTRRDALDGVSFDRNSATKPAGTERAT